MTSTDLADLEAKFNARVLELLGASREHARFLAVRNLVPPREADALRWVHNVMAAPHASDATWETYLRQRGGWELGTGETAFRSVATDHGDALGAVLAALRAAGLLP